MKTLIADCKIVNEGRVFHGALLMENDIIEAVYEGDPPANCHYETLVDAAGSYVLPGVIDTHVHFREPGLTHKADMASESRAAAAGGVTSYFDMPNTSPATVTLDALHDKQERARRDSMVNYAFFFGATNDNYPLFAQLDRSSVPGVKLFMGSSTGNMLVDREEALKAVFAEAHMPVMAHCEDTGIINNNMQRLCREQGDDPDVRFHPMVRSREACLASTRLGIDMARQAGARLHVAHLSTAEELDLIPPYSGTGPMPGITAEAVVAHLCFTDRDYAMLGTRIKCNPAVKTEADRDALRRALTDGRIATVATDHAPHLLSEKQGGCRRAASGMPMVQFSLRFMLQLASQGVLPLERVATLMCHQPARLFGVRDRGFLRPGYKADVVMVRPGAPRNVTAQEVLSKCGWSPLEGTALQWQVLRTYCNGQLVYARSFSDVDADSSASGRYFISEQPRGEMITFDHEPA